MRISGETSEAMDCEICKPDQAFNQAEDDVVWHPCSTEATQVATGGETGAPAGRVLRKHGRAKPALPASLRSLLRAPSAATRRRSAWLKPSPLDSRSVAASRTTLRLLSTLRQALRPALATSSRLHFVALFRQAASRVARVLLARLPSLLVPRACWQSCALHVASDRCRRSPVLSAGRPAFPRYALRVAAQRPGLS